MVNDICWMIHIVQGGYCSHYPHLIGSHIVVDLVHCAHHGAHCSHQLVEGISFWQLQVAQIHSYGVALTQSDCPLLISHPIV